MTKIKVCGVTLADDAARVAAAGVDFLGLNFWPSSKRYLPPERAAAVAAAARGAGPAQLVGVFVNAEPSGIVAIARDLALDVIQLHGDEPPDHASALAHATGCAVWKAIAAGTAEDLARLEAWPVDAILLDAPAAGRGGSGQVFDWEIAQGARRAHPQARIVLAGGLGPHNVGAAIEAVRPWAVDVASGVEATPGLKDPAKVAAFVAEVRAQDRPR